MFLEKIQIISVVISVLFLFFVFELVRRRAIKEAYAILWFSSGMVFIALSVWKRGLDYFSQLVGIYYPPAFLFLMLIFALILILVQFSVVVSSHHESLKKLTQEIALLKAEIETEKHKKNNSN